MDFNRSTKTLCTLDLQKLYVPSLYTILYMKHSLRTTPFKILPAQSNVLSFVAIAKIRSYCGCYDVFIWTWHRCSDSNEPYHLLLVSTSAFFQKNNFWAGMFLYHCSLIFFAMIITTFHNPKQIYLLKLRLFLQFFTIKVHIVFFFNSSNWETNW